MNRLFPVWLLFFLTASSHYSKPATQPSIRGYHIRFTMPVIGNDGSKSMQTEFYNVYYRGDDILYEYRYQFNSVTKGKSLKSSYRLAYFITYRDSTYGYYYDPSHQLWPGCKRMQRDSALKRIAFSSGDWSGLYTKTPGSSTRAQDPRHFTETYHFPAGEHLSMPCTVSFHYNAELNDLPESLEPVLDSTRHAKLVRIAVALPAGYDPKYKTSFPARTFSFEITPLEIKDLARLEMYFNSVKLNK